MIMSPTAEASKEKRRFHDLCGKVYDCAHSFVSRSRTWIARDWITQQERFYMQQLLFVSGRDKKHATKIYNMYKEPFFLITRLLTIVKRCKHSLQERREI